MLMLLFSGLMIAGAVGWFTRSRTPAGVSGPMSGPPPVPQQSYPQQAPTADARAEAAHWVDLLGAGLATIRPVVEGEGDPAARYALADAGERHETARTRLGDANSVQQLDLAGRTALEGLHYLRAARTALGLDPGPEIRPLSADGPVLDATRKVVVQGQELEASPEPGERTPYYYPGGTVQGRSVPAGWYSRPWWKTALVAGAAGVGSVLLIDSLFGHGGLFDHHGPMHGGMGDLGGGFGGMDGGFGDFF